LVIENCVQIKHQKGNRSLNMLEVLRFISDCGVFSFIVTSLISLVVLISECKGEKFVMALGVTIFLLPFSYLAFFVLKMLFCGF